MKDKEFTLEEIEVSHTLGGIHLVCVSCSTWWSGGRSCPGESSWGEGNEEDEHVTP